MVRIPIRAAASNVDDDLDAMRNYYRFWRKNNTDMNAPFFALFNSFKENELLKNLDEGALRLYLYFGFVSGNGEGTSWHSVETIARYFGKQTRTIDNWIKSLVDAGLIYRTRDHKKTNTTFLVPYTNTVVNAQPKKKHATDDQGLLDDLLASIARLSAVYGSVVKVFHVFHWGWNARSNEISAPATNFLFIITKRNDGLLVGHRYLLRKSDDYGVSELEIEDVAIFESPFVYQDHKVTGVAVNHSNGLRKKKNVQTLIELMMDLAVVEEDELLQHPTVTYGLIEDFFDLSDESEESKTKEKGGD